MGGGKRGTWRWDVVGSGREGRSGGLRREGL